MIRSRVNAFTIIELVISMLVTSVVIGITYASYLIVIRSYQSFTGKNKELAVIETLDHLLKRDFDRANLITKGTDSLIFNSDNLNTSYIFTEKYVLRRSAKTDTFYVKAKELIFGFEDLPIDNTQTIAEQNRIDKISFTILFQGEKIPYHYKKIYSSQNLINRKTDAVN